MSNPNLRDREIYNREVRRENQVIRENDSTAGGVILGVTLAALIGLAAGAFLLFNRQPATQQAPARNNTIIERTREVVPVPQPQPPDVNINVPSPTAPPAPNVNITVPSPTAPSPANQAPADPVAPTTAPTNP